MAKDVTFFDSCDPTPGADVFRQMRERLAKRPASDALMSECGKYRYWLSRIWDSSKPIFAWLMLNPSTADASINDATIRRCIGFTRAWGGGGIFVMNLFAFRATDPADMRAANWPVAEPPPAGNDPRYGNANDAWIVRQTAGRRIIAAWGCNGTFFERDETVMSLLAGRKVECLGVTKDGHPKHPVRLTGDLKPVPFILKGGRA